MTEVRRVFENVGDSAYWAGVHIGEGLANGMRSKIGVVRSVAAEMISEADKALSKKAELGSPSRLFARLGKFIPMGLAVGIKNGTEYIKDAAKGMVDNAITSIEGKALSTTNNSGLSNNNTIAIKKAEIDSDKAAKGNIVLNFYDTQTSPDAIYQKFIQSNTYGLARSY